MTDFPRALRVYEMPESRCLFYSSENERIQQYFTFLEYVLVDIFLHLYNMSSNEDNPNMTSIYTRKTRAKRNKASLILYINAPNSIFLEHIYVPK